MKLLRIELGDGVVAMIILLAFFALMGVVVVQTQNTERTKFTCGYEQQVVESSTTAVTTPMWRKAR